MLIFPSKGNPKSCLQLEGFEFIVTFSTSKWPKHLRPHLPWQNLFLALNSKELRAVSYFPLITKQTSVLCCAVPNVARNGLAGVLQRSLQPAFDDQVCFVATVRLAKPQFIKVSSKLVDFSISFFFKASVLRVVRLLLCL